MNTIGFPISHKENEKRRALVPADILHVKEPQKLFFEEGYGKVLGFSDDDYRVLGVNLVSRSLALSQSIICDPKIGDADYLDQLQGQTVFGWVHAVLNRDITDKLINGKITAYAWEDMYEKGRHVFWRNNEIAGEAAVSHAYMCHGIFPYLTKVAVLGRGNIARGAIRTLNFMGAEVIVYDRHMEALFREELPLYDVVVNAILWDKMRRDHVVYMSDLKRMKSGAMIIDISCDRAGAIETSRPTSITSPVYELDGVTHYVVDHTPALFFKSTTSAISKELPRYLDALVSGDIACLEKALIVKAGVIVDERINQYQHRVKSR